MDKSERPSVLQKGCPFGCILLYKCVMCDNFPSTPLKMKRRSKGVLLCNFQAIFGGELICYVAMRQRVGRFNLKIPLISPTVLLQFFAGYAGINLAAAAVLSAPVFQRTFYCLNRPRYMKEAKRERERCEVLSGEDTSRISPHQTWVGRRNDVR